MPEASEPRRVELFVRSLAAGDSQARVGATIERLDELLDAGAIDGYDVHLWGTGVSLDPRIVGTETGSFIRERVASFQEWAHESGRELPGFEVETRSSAMTGRVHRNVAVPTMAICERHDGVVEWVAPCADEAGTTTVEDRLAALETTGRGEPESAGDA